MTPNEIKNLIDQKIAGQGTMVDVGGALPTILKAIVDMAGGALSPYVLEQDIPSSQPTIIAATRNVSTDAIEIADEEKIKLQPLIENGEWQKAIVRIGGAYDYAILATTHQPNLYSITIRAREQVSIKDVTISWSEIQA